MKTIVTYSAELVILAFLAITFIQSGWDKIIGWKGNLSWLTEHFSKTFLKNYVPPMLLVVLLAETLAGLCCAAGIVQLFLTGNTTLGYYGAFISCIALLMLLFGQRVAKDYAGAQTIAVYFIIAAFGLFLLAS